MTPEFMERLLKARACVLDFDETGRQCKYRLAKFDGTYMARDCIQGTPFRYFECVPRNRSSRRKQNDTMAFDAYEDTLFDYPLIVKMIRSCAVDALEEFNFFLTVQVPYCGMDCWHCYNDKKVSEPGILKAQVSVDSYSAADILDQFRECKERPPYPGHRYNVLRVSGGEPFLAPEMMAELLQLMRENEQDQRYPTLLWTETNLLPWVPGPDGRSLVDTSCEEAQKRSSLDIRRIFAEQKDRLVIHPCFHGLTDENVTQCSLPDDLASCARLSFGDLLRAFNRLHDFLGDGQRLHLYPSFIADACDPTGVDRLFAQLQHADPCYPLKVAIVSADFYGPIRARFEKRRTQFTCYSKHASLRRWNLLLEQCYGLYYAQLPRPLAEAVSREMPTVEPVQDGLIPPYEPRIMLLKGTGRKDYRQEILSILAAPPESEILTTYDMNHVDPSVVNWLKSRHRDEDLLTLNESAVVIYCNPNATRDEVRYLPLREATIRNVQITGRLLHLSMTLGRYIVAKNGGPGDAKSQLMKFQTGMIGYFGESALLERGKMRWVLLGEKALLRQWAGEDDAFEFMGLSQTHSWDPKSLRDGWERLLDIIKSISDLEDLRKWGVFLQLLASSVIERDRNREDTLVFREGQIAEYELRYYIPDFGDYDKGDLPQASRTIKIVSSASSLAVRGYEAKPLSKYGTLAFQVVCNELEHDMPAELIIEPEDQSYHCPRLSLRFSLKKKEACDGLSMR